MTTAQLIQKFDGMLFLTTIKDKFNVLIISSGGSWMRGPF